MVGTKSNATSLVASAIINKVDDVGFGLELSTGAQTGEGTTHFVSQLGGRVGEVSAEMNGLRNIISESSILGGLSPTEERQWKALVDSSTTNLSIAALLTAQQKVRQRQGKDPTFLLTGLQQQKRLYESLEQQVQFGTDKGLEAGNDSSAR